MQSFPSNPSDGEIFEQQSGVYFIYDRQTNSWMQVDGSFFPDVATPNKDGLMSADDYNKLNSLIAPPPQSTIKGEDCSGAFTTGTINLVEGDKFISISGVAKTNAGEIPRELYPRTHAFDFRLNVPELLDWMKENGKLVIKAAQGEQGKQGERGEDGEDSLPFGPDGPQGEKGANAPVALTLTSETIPFNVKEDTSKAVVSVSTEEISDTENYLVLTRSNIGNADACPSKIRIQDGSSNWVLAMSPTVTSTTCECQNPVYYIDMTQIVNPIRDKFYQEAERVKHSTERIVSFWLQHMSAAFDEQKSALCCALEHCKSRTRNANYRTYIEQQRIQAAQANFKLLIDGSPTESSSICPDIAQLNGGMMATLAAPAPFADPVINQVNFVPVSLDDKYKAYEVSYSGEQSGIMSKTDTSDITRHFGNLGPGQYYIYIRNVTRRNQPINIVSSSKNLVFKSGSGAGWRNTYLDSYNIKADVGPGIDNGWWIEAEVIDSSPSNQMINVFAATNFGSSKNGVAVDLDKGTYIAEILDTSAMFDNQFTGVVKIIYNDGEAAFQDFGLFGSIVKSKQAYRGLTFEFTHNGGEVVVYIPVTPRSSCSGSTVIKITESSKYYKNVRRPVVVKQAATAHNTCSIHHSHVRWYEDSWKSNKGCGCIVNIAGQDYVIIKRSIGSDMSCGGGETMATPCLKMLADVGHPAFAWPTFDGNLFVGIPTSGSVTFKYDTSLNSLFKQALVAKDVSDVKGNAQGIEVVLFPVL